MKVSAYSYQSVTTSLKCSFPQSMSDKITGIRDLPVSVSEYSTRGGTSGNTSLCTRWLCSRFFNVWESIFCEQSVIWWRISLNLNTPLSLLLNKKSTNIDHLSPKRLITCLMGHEKYSAFISAITPMFSAKVTKSYQVTARDYVNLR